MDPWHPSYAIGCWTRSITCGYAPTVGLRSQATIALVYAGPFTVGSPYDAACLDGIVTAMLDSEYDLKIVHLRRDKKPDETYSQFFLA